MDETMRLAIAEEEVHSGAEGGTMNFQKNDLRWSRTSQDSLGSKLEMYSGTMYIGIIAKLIQHPVPIFWMQQSSHATQESFYVCNG